VMPGAWRHIGFQSLYTLHHKLKPQP
jgi:hypothetical protein